MVARQGENKDQHGFSLTGTGSATELSLSVHVLLRQLTIHYFSTTEYTDDKELLFSFSVFYVCSVVLISVFG